MKKKKGLCSKGWLVASNVDDEYRIIKIDISSGLVYQICVLTKNVSKP